MTVQSALSKAASKLNISDSQESGKSRQQPPAGIKLPQNGSNGSNGHYPQSLGMKTPKTPQDEALAFFASGDVAGEPVQVWELWLENDGGPGENKSVSLTCPCVLLEC